MATEAKVRSLDDLEAFRSSLIVYITRARRGVEQADEELKHMRNWLSNDQRTHWTEQLRKRTRQLDQANAELMSAKLSTLRENITPEKLAQRKAKAAVEEAQQKLENIRRWTREFDRLADPIARKLETLHHFLEHTMPEGVQQLAGLHRTLEDYAGTGSPFNAVPPSPSSAEPGTPPSPSPPPPSS